MVPSPIRSPRLATVMLAAALLPATTVACSSGIDSSSPPATTAPTSAGTSSSAGAPTTSTPSAPTTTGGGPSTTAPPTTSIADECTAADLDVTLGPSSAAAGTAYVAVLFTNRSSDACSMRGYPGVSYVDAGGAQIGAAARRDPQPAEVVVPLAPGAVAHALVGTANAVNYPQAECGTPVTAASLRIYPPDSTTAIDLPASSSVCPNDVGQLSVKAVAAGAGDG